MVHIFRLISRKMCTLSNSHKLFINFKYYNMENIDRLFEGLHMAIFKRLPDLTQKNNDAVVVRVLFFVLLILIIAGDEVTKILFRKGFGTKAIHWWKLTLCIAAFGSMSFICYVIGISEHESNKYRDFATPFSFLVGVGFHAFTALVLLFKGFVSPRNKKAYKYYRGESELLAFLIEKGWSPVKVQNLYEPLSLLVVGAFLSALNPFIGLPFVFCAISSWVNMFIENIHGYSSVRNHLALHGYQSENITNFTYAQ